MSLLLLLDQEGIGDTYLVVSSTNPDILDLYVDGVKTATFKNAVFNMIGVSSLGDGGTTNYAQISAAGEMSFAGTSRINWSKITADNVTLTAGTSGETVSDLQTAFDGNTYDIDEAAATPGYHLEVEFVSVTAFNWVSIIASYKGSATHYAEVQLYNFDTTAWDTFTSLDTHAALIQMENYSFFVPDDTNYIGTAGDAGDVRVRFYHTPAGNASHDVSINVVALYQ